MRILHVIHSMEPEFGGPSFALCRIARALSTLGLDVEIAATHAPGGDHRSLAKELGQVAAHEYPRIPGSNWGFSPGLLSWLYKHIACFDVVHVHGVFTFPVIASTALARLHKVPYILRPIGNLDPWSLAQKRRKKQLFLKTWGERMLRHAAAIHATSLSERDAVLRLSPSTPAVVIPHGVELPAITTPKARDGGRLLFLGRVHPKKAPEVVLKALRRLHDAGRPLQLSIAGSGERQYVESLKRMVQDMGLTRHVSFLGEVTAEDKARAFLDADVFVLPSYQENFGIAVAEALSYGLPAVVSDQVALAEQIQQSRAGTVVPTDDATALARAIERVLDPQQYEEFSRQARVLAEAEFSLNSQANRLKALYWSALKARTGGHIQDVPVSAKIQ